MRNAYTWFNIEIENNCVIISPEGGGYELEATVVDSINKDLSVRSEFYVGGGVTEVLEPTTPDLIKKLEYVLTTRLGFASRIHPIHRVHQTPEPA